MKKDERKLIDLVIDEVTIAKLRCFDKIHDFIMNDTSELAPHTINRVVSDAFKEYVTDVSNIQKMYAKNSPTNKSMEDFYKFLH